MHTLIEVMRHLPDYLQSWATAYGAGVYLILALIIFAETGLVVTPFLPGDSLLFATGALVSLNLPNISLVPMILILIVAAFLGDTLNYFVGRWAARRLFVDGRARFLNPKHLERTREFYARHGGKTVVLARFLPILRTYAPFVSGMSAMPYARYVVYSLGGATVWIASFISLGYYFGNLPAVKANFHYAILGIIVISFIPVVIEFVRSSARPKTAIPSKS